MWGLVQGLPLLSPSHPSLTITKILNRVCFFGYIIKRLFRISSYINPVKLLVHGPAISFILIGWDHFVHVDPDRGQDAMQLIHGLLGQGGLSAHDPRQLRAEGAKLCAAVDQSVTLVVCGQHPVGTRGRGCRRDRSIKGGGAPLKKESFFETERVTFVEGDLQLGRLSGVLHFCRADDGKNAPVITINQS